MIADSGNSISVSVATLWEISIKHSLDRKGGGVMPISGRTAMELFERARFTEPLRLVTGDRLLARYSDTVIVV